MNRTSDGRSVMGMSPNRIYAVAAALAVAALILALAIAETLGALGIVGYGPGPAPSYAALAADPACPVFDSTLREVETRRAGVGD
jgi:hypothetical protein